VCGAVVNVRNKGDRISIWTRTGSNEAAQTSIGKSMKSILDLNETTRLGYMLHDDAIKLDRKAKDRYTV
jgi:translation initiation factor 4E